MYTKLSKGTIYGIIFLVVLWQGIAMFIAQPALFPSVTDLIMKLYHLLCSYDFYIALANTILRGLIGFVIALVLALLLATTALHHDFWRNFLHPLIVTIRSIPVISLVLIALLWISPPGLPVFIALFTMFPILYQNILSGLEQTDLKLIEMATVYRKTAFQRFVNVYLPASFPIIISGMSTAMGFGWRAIIIGEVLAGPVHGIGTSMKKAQAFIEVQELLAWTVVAVVVSFIFDAILKKQSGKVTKLKLKVINNNLPANNTSDLNLKGFEICELNKKYNDTVVINNLSAQFSNEAIYLLKSASGSGKTTLMKIIAGICKYESGIIHLNNNYNIGYAFQDLRLIPWMNVLENIAFALPSYPYINQQEDIKTKELVDLLGLTDKKNNLPTELSGGEQQRVNLARALIVSPDILLLDEPLNGLGQELKIRTINTIERWIYDNKPVIIWATHEDIEKYTEKVCYNLELTDPGQ